MKIRIAEENTDAADLIAPNQPKVTCKRKGLMITLTIGEKKGEALMRYIEDGPDVKNILRRAIENAAEDAGTEFIVEDGVIYLDI